MKRRHARPFPHLFLTLAAALLLLSFHVPSQASQVRVKVSTTLAVPPSEAKAAWLQYAWEEGGGLPLVASLVSGDKQERTLLPLLLREKLRPSPDDGEEEEEEKLLSCEYTLTDAGALRADVIAETHQGRVVFAPSASSSSTTSMDNDHDTAAACTAAAATATELTWSVAFDCTARAELWEAVTRSTVGTVVANLEALTAQPSTFTLCAEPLYATSGQCLDTWLECLEDGDLGVPMPPPIVLDEGEGATRVGYERLILPPGLRERVLGIERGGEADGGEVNGGERCSVAYTVVNPSWLTCYPAHTHRGDVEFSAIDKSSGRSKMRWTVAVRPQLGGAFVVRQLTSFIIPAFSRNMARRIGLSQQQETTEAEQMQTEVTFGWDSPRSSGL